MHSDPFFFLCNHIEVLLMVYQLDFITTQYRGAQTALDWPRNNVKPVKSPITI